MVRRSFITMTLTVQNILLITIRGLGGMARKMPCNLLLSSSNTEKHEKWWPKWLMNVFITCWLWTAGSHNTFQNKTWFWKHFNFFYYFFLLFCFVLFWATYLSVSVKSRLVCSSAWLWRGEAEAYLGNTDFLRSIHFPLYSIPSTSSVSLLFCFKVHN